VSWAVIIALLHLHPSVKATAPPELRLRLSLAAAVAVACARGVATRIPLIRHRPLALFVVLCAVLVEDLSREAALSYLQLSSGITLPGLLPLPGVTE
jgi:hypothetical protein